MRRVVLNTVVMIFVGLLMAAKLSAHDRKGFPPGFMGKTINSPVACEDQSECRLLNCPGSDTCVLCRDKKSSITLSFSDEGYKFSRKNEKKSYNVQELDTMQMNKASQVYTYAWNTREFEDYKSF